MKLDHHHKQINSIYGDEKLNEKDVESLDKKNVTDEYSK
jgi:hypothetical protein